MIQHDGIASKNSLGGAALAAHACNVGAAEAALPKSIEQVDELKKMGEMDAMAEADGGGL